MGFLRDFDGKISHKRVISLALIIVYVIMGFMEYSIEYIYFFGIAGLVNIGMTVYSGVKSSVKIADIPPEDHDQKPPKK